MAVFADLDGKVRLRKHVRNAPITWLDADDALGLQLLEPTLKFLGKRTAIGGIVQLRVNGTVAFGALLLAEMTHGPEEEGDAFFVLRNVGGFLADLHLQDGVESSVEAIERGACRIELVAENENQIAYCGGGSVRAARQRRSAPAQRAGSEGTATPIRLSRVISGTSCS